MPTFDPKIELCSDNHALDYALDFPGFQGNDADIISRMWNEWYDRRQKEAKEYTKCRHKAEIADAASQYEQ